MLDITQLLQDTIYFDNQIIEQRDLLLGPDSHLKEILVHCDRSLASLYQPAISYDLIKAPAVSLSNQQILERYVAVLHWFLLFSAQKQWTHLVVMDETSYHKLTKAKPVTKLADQDQQYLTIKYFLFTSYYTHRQADFRHAWRLLIKYGLVYLKLSTDAIMQEHERLIKENIR